MTRDEWPKYICCVLTVREELIKENPAMVQDLVNHVLGAGQWLDQSPANRETAVQIAAGPTFFNQDPKIIRFVMQNPSDRVTYGDLRMIRSEFEELMQLSMQAGTIKHPIPYEKYVDEQFAHSSRAAAIAL
jgi:NitT/TauT family transport system substrate-binding protein